MCTAVAYAGEDITNSAIPNNHWWCLKPSTCPCYRLYEPVLPLYALSCYFNLSLLFAHPPTPLTQAQRASHEPIKPFLLVCCSIPTKMQPWALNFTTVYSTAKYLWRERTSGAHDGALFIYYLYKTKISPNSTSIHFNWMVVSSNRLALNCRLYDYLMQPSFHGRAQARKLVCPHPKSQTQHSKQKMIYFRFFGAIKTSDS